MYVRPNAALRTRYRKTHTLRFLFFFSRLFNGAAIHRDTQALALGKPRHDLRYPRVHFSRPYRSVK